LGDSPLIRLEDVRGTGPVAMRRGAASITGGNEWLLEGRSDCTIRLQKDT
jgi:hypothetical protein